MSDLSDPADNAWRLELPRQGDMLRDVLDRLEASRGKDYVRVVTLAENLMRSFNKVAHCVGHSLLIVCVFCSWLIRSGAPLSTPFSRHKMSPVHPHKTAQRRYRRVVWAPTPVFRRPFQNPRPVPISTRVCKTICPARRVPRPMAMNYPATATRPMKTRYKRCRRAAGIVSTTPAAATVWSRRGCCSTPSLDVRAGAAAFAPRPCSPTCARSSPCARPLTPRTVSCNSTGVHAATNCSAPSATCRPPCCRRPTDIARGLRRPYGRHGHCVRLPTA